MKYDEDILHDHLAQVQDGVWRQVIQVMDRMVDALPNERGIQYARDALLATKTGSGDLGITLASTKALLDQIDRDHPNLIQSD